MGRSSTDKERRRCTAGCFPIYIIRCLSYIDMKECSYYKECTCSHHVSPAV